MNISMQLIVVVAACLCVSEGAPDGRMGRKQQRPTRGFKNVEMMTARGFGKRDGPHTRAEQTFEAPARKIFKPKNSLMVAYDFGKRSGNENTDEEEEIRVTRGTFRPTGNKVLIARGYGKRAYEGVVDMDDFLQTLASSPEKEPESREDKIVESMPLDLLVMEMMNNPEFTRSVVRKFVDINQDGMLSLEELLRNVA